MASRTVTGRFVQKCPKCGGTALSAIAHQCLACQTLFLFPKRRVFKRQSEALKSYGTVEVDSSKRFFVAVCPTCDVPLFVDHAFQCTCGAQFDRWQAILIWKESSKEGKRAPEEKSDT